MPDKSWEKTGSIFSDAVDSLFAAIQSGEKKKWMSARFNKEYPKDLAISSIVYDVISTHLIDAVREIYQCENCQRIAIQVGDTNRFLFFSPDGTNSKDILDPEREE